jgi:hypothetical protein
VEGPKRAAHPDIGHHYPDHQPSSTIISHIISQINPDHQPLNMKIRSLFEAGLYGLAVRGSREPEGHEWHPPVAGRDGEHLLSLLD